jgi:hypothetical protein
MESSRRTTWWIVGLALALIVGVGVSVLTRGDLKRAVEGTPTHSPVSSAGARSHPGGDPNGTVVQTMKTIRFAVPPDAKHVSIHAYPTQWVPGCSEIRNSRAGWDEETVYVTFTVRDSATLVDRHIGTVLQMSGWSSSPMRITEGQGLVPHWLRTVSGAPPINAFAYAAPSGSDAWFLTASWRPRPVGEGCP